MRADINGIILSELVVLQWVGTSAAAPVVTELGQIVCTATHMTAGDMTSNRLLEFLGAASEPVVEQKTRPRSIVSIVKDYLKYMD